MKLFLILIFLTISSIAFTRTKDKIVNIRLFSFKVNGIYEKIGNDYYYVLITENNEKFYMKHDILQGTKTTMQISKGNMKNGKLVEEIEMKEYFIYDLKCIKINDVYFNCVE